MTGIYKDNSLY